MRYITLILLTAILIAGAYFYVLNQEVIASRVSIGFADFYDVPLYLIVFSAVGFGILWSLLVYLAQELRLRFRIMHLKSENKKMKKEIDILRNQPLQGITPEKDRGEA
mgnify:CR=1 FL=1